MEIEKKIIISLGGSLVVPDGIDTDFINSFKKVILKKIEEGHTFYILVGGGKICREYQQALHLTDGHDVQALDWMGIHVTRLNAQLIKMSFGEIADENIITDPGIIPETDKKIIIGAGWKPGWSTDYVATEVARTVGAHAVINVSNISYVYTADPKKDPGAKPIKDINWEDFRKLIPEEWDPGLNSPFDPIASRDAQELGIEVVVMGGNTRELEKCLSGEEFEGTIIHP